MIQTAVQAKKLRKCFGSNEVLKGCSINVKQGTKNLELHLSYMNALGLGVDKALQMVGLPDTGQQAVSQFSMGMRQRLGIAVSLITLANEINQMEAI